VTLPFVTVFIATVFLLSGLGKFTARDSIRPFTENIGVPQSLARPLARLIPAAEIVLAILLALGIAIRWTAIAAAILASSFLAAHAIAWLRGNAPSCRCFGALDTEVRPAVSALRSGFFLAVAILVAIMAAGSAAKPSGVPVGSGLAALSGFMAAVSYILVFHLTNEIITLVSRDRYIDRTLTEKLSRT
jgi:uncharacterized membrane protein YphA (DoxX/SURF4 family)